MSSFNPNIPQPTDKILQSFYQLRGNFNAINSVFGVNHVALTQDTTISGMHTVLTLRPQTADPTTSADEIALYNKLVTYAGKNIPNLFFAPNSSQTPIQMTYPSIKSDDSDTQYTFMAGPFIIYGGLLKNLTQANNGQLITLTPGTTLIYVDLTVANAVIGPLIIGMAIPVNISGTSFNINFQPIGIGEKFDLYYLAIGI